MLPEKKVANDRSQNDHFHSVNTHMNAKEVDPFHGKSIYEIMMLSQMGRKSQGSDGLLPHKIQPTAIQPDLYYSYERALAAPPKAKSEDSSDFSKGKIPAESGPFSSATIVSLQNSGQFKKLTYLPYHLPWQPVAGPNETPINNNWLVESCAGKAAMGIFGGGVMGLLMGVFLGAMSDMTPPVTVINGKEVPQAPLKEQMKTTMRATGQKSLYWCRQFAFITGVFSGTECVFEKARGQHDVWNEVLGGCVTGAAMQGKHGPQAAAVGCGGFAAFSLVIAQVMGTHS